MPLLLNKQFNVERDRQGETDKLILVHSTSDNQSLAQIIDGVNMIYRKVLCLAHSTIHTTSIFTLDQLLNNLDMYKKISAKRQFRRSLVSYLPSSRLVFTWVSLSWWPPVLQPGSLLARGLGIGPCHLDKFVSCSQ